MIILGIDPGSRKAGFSVIKQEGKTLSYIASGVLRYDKIDNFLDRLGLIYHSCEKLIEKFSPDEIALESLIYVKSVTSLAKLAQARGAMVAAFMKTHERKVFEYSPNLVKSLVTGFGHADKESVDRSLKLIFKKDLTNVEFKTHDESDAIAIAVAHALSGGKMNVKNNSRGGSTLRSAFSHLK